jgi:hypothetical protein
MAAKNHPTPLGRILEGSLPAKLAGRLPGPGLLRAWRVAAGPTVAAKARPLALDPGGVLVVGVASSIWRQELGLLAPRLVAALRQEGQEVASLKLVLDRPPDPPPPPPPPPPPLTPDQERQVAQAVDHVAHPDLRHALADLLRAQLRAGSGDDEGEGA